MAGASGQEKRKEDRRAIERRWVSAELTLDDIFAEGEGEKPAKATPPTVQEQRHGERRRQIRRADDRALYELITGTPGA